MHAPPAATRMRIAETMYSKGEAVSKTSNVFVKKAGDSKGLVALAKRVCIHLPHKYAIHTMQEVAWRVQCILPILLMEASSCGRQHSMSALPRCSKAAQSRHRLL